MPEDDPSAAAAPRMRPRCAQHRHHLYFVDGSDVCYADCMRPTSTPLAAYAPSPTLSAICTRGAAVKASSCVTRARQKNGRSHVWRAGEGSSRRSTGHRDMSWGVNCIAVARFARRAVVADHILQSFASLHRARSSAGSAMLKVVGRGAPCADETWSAICFPQVSGGMWSARSRTWSSAGQAVTRATLAI